jgi:diguanylate cyclase (GGDEF)-like protein
VIGAVEIFSDNSTEIDARRKLEAMNRLAFLDHLTQLPNRRFMEMSLQTAVSEFQVHKDPLGVLVLDLDGFKDINDSFGHSCGDRALLEAANTLIGALRPTDIVGRWGGDEFLAIVRNVNLESLRELAERCVVLISETSVPCNETARIPLVISVGAALSRPGETPKTLFQRADKLMYRSKAEGRGRATTE